MEATEIDFSRQAISAEELKPQGPPEVLLALVPEASTLWPKLFRRVDFEMFYNFGFDDLMFRFKCQLARELRRSLTPDYQQRARIWYHVVSASSKGKSDIPDLTESNLLEWTPTFKENKTHTVSCMTCGKRFQQMVGSKFASCQKCRGAKLKLKAVEKQVEVIGGLPDGWKACAACEQPFESKRAGVKFCSNKPCQKKRAAHRQDAARVKKVVTNVSLLSVPVESYVSDSL